MKSIVSVIIPVLNEAAQIGGRLKMIEARETGYVKEVFVVDGGSSDDTVDIALKNGAKVVYTGKGRARQMNAGAKNSAGDILYFLHADTEPPSGFDREIVEAIGKDFDFGCFRLEFDWNHPLLRFYSWFTRFRSTGVRFGDQSLFVAKNIFEKAGGFDEGLVVMEGQEIYRRLHNYGEFYLSTRSVITSARKYKKAGPVKLQIFFTLVWLGYYFGVKQKTLVKFYKKFISP